MSQTGIHIRILTSDDVMLLKPIRRRALVEHPEAYGTSPDDFDRITDAVHRERLSQAPHSVTFGAFDGGTLLGTIWVGCESGSKRQHRGLIAAMYVVPEYRGRGIGRMLLNAGLDHLRSQPQIEQVVLAVTAGNVAARTLYRSAGFISWGMQPDYIRTDSGDYDMEWMVYRIEG